MEATDRPRSVAFIFQSFALVLTCGYSLHMQKKKKGNTFQCSHGALGVLLVRPTIEISKVRVFFLHLFYRACFRKPSGPASVTQWGDGKRSSPLGACSFCLLHGLAGACFLSSHSAIQITSSIYSGIIAHDAIVCLLLHKTIDSLATTAKRARMLGTNWSFPEGLEEP